jgi:hypothetical protein
VLPATRFLAAAQKVMEDLFPGTVKISGGEPLVAVFMVSLFPASGVWKSARVSLMIYLTE